MKNKTYILNMLLVGLLTLVLLAMFLAKVFFPRIILPQADLPNLVLISLAVLVLDHYLVRGAGRCWACVAVFSFLSFGLLPLASCLFTPTEALILGLKGCGVFTACTWLFDSAADRLSTGPAAKAAPALTALGKALRLNLRGRFGRGFICLSVLAITAAALVIAPGTTALTDLSMLIIPAVNMLFMFLLLPGTLIIGYLRKRL